MTYKGKFSPKNYKKYKGDRTKIIYRSSWELRFMKWLDHNNNVLSWGSETVIVPYKNPIYRFINAIGKVEGSISKFKKGKNGFGYDPIFLPLNKKITFGQMKPKEKYKIDHRMKAFKKIRKFF